MADNDGQERTEDPTSKKIEDARQKGQIARSKEFGTLFVLVGTAFALFMMGESLVGALKTIFARFFALTRNEVLDVNAMFGIISSTASVIIWPLAGIFAIVMLAAFAGNVILGGLSFSTEAMSPKWSKLSPIAGFKRMLGVQALVEFTKALLKFLVVAGVAYLLLVGLFEEILALSIEAMPRNFEHAIMMLLWMFTTLCISLLIIAAIDAPYQIWNHNRQLKMTKQEIKDEMKNAEGSPEVKGRIRRLQYEMSQRRMMAEVPKADVVITNPTHYSVALKYDTSGGGAPVLVAKGVDEVAMHIRKIAKEHEVEIITSPMLARSIYYTTDIDKDIPEQLFAAVAQVLAFVFQLRQHKKGRAKRPIPLAKNLPIPNDFKY